MSTASRRNSTYHDVMCQTLSQIIAAAVSPERNCTEEHLNPTNNWVGLAHYSVRYYCPWADGLVVYVQFEVHAKHELEEDGYKENVCHDAVRAGKESSAAMYMSEDVSSKGQCNACALSDAKRNERLAKHKTSDGPAVVHAIYSSSCQGPFPSGRVCPRWPPERIYVSIVSRLRAHSSVLQ